jgi:neutral ceramidase
MRRIALSLSAMVLMLSAPAMAQTNPPAGAAKVLRAGAATANITPPLGELIVGNFTTPPATYVHDELHVRCLVLDDGTNKIAFAIGDNVGIAKPALDAARKLIVAETDIPAHHILMASTHTHSGTSARSSNSLKPDPELSDYSKFLARRIADGVRCALNNLEPAEIGWGSVDVPDQVFNRRWLLQPGVTMTNPFGGQDKAKMNPGNLPTLLEPAGPTDPQVYFLSVRAAGGGRPIALLANYSLHYVGGVPTGHISADYFAEFANRIAQKLDAERLDPPFVGIMSNGTSGDVNNVNVRNRGPAMKPYEKMRLVAEQVAEAVYQSLKSVNYQSWVPVDAKMQDLELATRKPTAEQIEFAKSVLAAPEGQEPKYPLVRPYASRVIQLADSPDTVTVPLQALRIGDLGIGAIPFEVFAECGLSLKKNSPFPSTFTISIANGSFGYLPTPRHFELGGYETWLGTNRVEVKASDKIERVILELLGELKAGK